MIKQLGQKEGKHVIRLFKLKRFKPKHWQHGVFGFTVQLKFSVTVSWFLSPSHCHIRKNVKFVSAFDP